ncbi:MAG: PKD domain-containing protein [Candidatus Methanoperedens sp.]|nr:PKD domain-containing protein [Candidatus Methanoperedens sp.]
MISQSWRAALMALLMCLLLDVIPIFAQDTPVNDPKTCQSVEQSALLKQVNEYRVENDLPPLVFNKVLCAVADDQVVAWTRGATRENGFVREVSPGVSTRLSNWLADYNFITYSNLPPEEKPATMATLESSYNDFEALFPNFLLARSENPPAQAQELLKFFLTDRYREIGIGYRAETAGTTSYKYVFIVASRANIIPVIPVDPDERANARYEFDSSEVGLWINTENYYTGADPAIMVGIQYFRVVEEEQPPNTIDCPERIENGSDWKTYTNYDVYVPRGSGEITLYVQLCDVSSQAHVEPVSINIVDTSKPVADFSMGRVEGAAPVTVRLSDRSRGNVKTRAWDCTSDGTIESSAPEVECRYDKAGIYTATLKVTDGFGNESLRSETITVSEPTSTPQAPPKAIFTTSVLAGVEPLTVAFDSTDSTGGIVLRKWYFDTDTNVDSNDIVVSHTFSAGQHTVRLVVEDSQGRSDTYETVITVDQAVPSDTPMPTNTVAVKPT